MSLLWCSIQLDIDHDHLQITSYVIVHTSFLKQLYFTLESNMALSNIKS